MNEKLLLLRLLQLLLLLLLDDSCSCCCAPLMLTLITTTRCRYCPSSDMFSSARQFFSCQSFQCFIEILAWAMVKRSSRMPGPWTLDWLTLQ